MWRGWLVRKGRVGLEVGNVVSSRGIQYRTYVIVKFSCCGFR
jgi:hypothetical protein